MDKDFEKWLKKDDLYKFYKNNPEQQQQIYDEYLDEKESFAYTNPDEWFKWAMNNYELAKKEFPNIMNDLEQGILNSNPILFANSIQRLPLNFYKWKKEVEQYAGKVREKKIKEQISLLDGLLNKWKYSDEIINNAIESVRKELEEQLEYWKNELHNIPQNHIDLEQNRTKKVIKEAFESIDNKGWKFAFRSKDDFELFIEILTRFFEQKEYTLPNEIIHLKRGSKTKIAKILGELHKDLVERVLKHDKEYFKIIKILSHFEKEKDTDLYKALTR